MGLRFLCKLSLSATWISYSRVKREYDTVRLSEFTVPNQFSRAIFSLCSIIAVMQDSRGSFVVFFSLSRAVRRDAVQRTQKMMAYVPTTKVRDKVTIIQGQRQ